MTTEASEPRLTFLDNIKAIFALLVIFQHARVTYEGSGWWYYVEPAQADTFSTIFFMILLGIGGLFQSSLMGLFFLMGGFFTPRSYDRKGVAAFWKERLLRLGLPLLLYVVVINPVLSYLLSLAGTQPIGSGPARHGSFIAYYLSRFSSPAELLRFLTFTGPMWFLYVLLILTAAYTLWRRVIAVASLRRHLPDVSALPSFSFFFLLALALGGLAFTVRLVFPIDSFPLSVPVAFMGQYLMMFGVGVLAIRNNWIEQMTAAQVKAWAVTIVAAVVLFYAYFFVSLGPEADTRVLLGGLNPHALVFALAENLICMGMIFVLLRVSYTRFNQQGPLMRRLSSSAFHIYLIHAPVLVLVSLGFVFIPLVPVVKLALVFPLTVLLCYLLSRHFIQEPRLREPPRLIERSSPVSGNAKV